MGKLTESEALVDDKGVTVRLGLHEALILELAMGQLDRCLHLCFFDSVRL